MSSFALLISRQPRAVTSRSWWLICVNAVCNHALERKWRLVTGKGLTTMDYAAWRYERLGGSVEIVSLTDGDKRRALEERDVAVAGKAERLIAIAVRRGGNMERLAVDALAKGRELHVISPPPGARGRLANDALLSEGARKLELALPNPPLISPPPWPVSAAIAPPPCLWHCTRSSPGPWPGQSSQDYFASLADNESGSSHSARDTLDRILQENRIRADGRLIRGSHPVVCLSERTPDELVADRRFRPALSRWEFEPVAIGLGLEHCLALGFKPVRYRPEAEYDKLPSEDRPYFQKSQPGALETEHEREWRALGDINLAAIPYAAQFLFDHGLCVPRSEL